MKFLNQHNILTLLFLILTPFLAVGQNSNEPVHVTVHNNTLRQLDESPIGTSATIGEDKTMFFISYTTKGLKIENYFVAIYDSTFSFVKQIVLNEDILPKGATLFSSHYVDGKILLTYFVFSKKEKTQQLFAVSLNPENFEVLKKSQKLLSIHTKAPVFSLSYFRALSTNLDQLAIAIVQPETKNEPQVINLLVLNGDGDMVWSQKINTPPSESTFTISKVLLSSDGTCYILSGMHSTEKKVQNTRIFHLDAVDADGLIEDIFISLDKGYIFEADIIFDPDESVVCAGLFLDEAYGLPDGTFYKSFDKGSLSESGSAQAPFEADFQDKMYHETELKTGIKYSSVHNYYSIDPFEIKGLSINDGIVSIMFECHYSIFSIDGVVYDPICAEHNDILSVAMEDGNNNELIWAQLTRSPCDSDYTPTYQKDNVFYAIYHEKSKSSNNFNYKLSVLNIETGEVKIHDIEFGKGSLIAITTSGHSLSNWIMVLYLRSKGGIEHSLTTIELPK